MPKNADLSEIKPTPPKLVSRKQTMDMVLAELESGDGIASRLTESHIDTLLQQRDKIIDKVHEDRKGERFDGKFYFLLTLLFALIVLTGVAFIKPEFLNQAIVALVSGLGGYGYGYGKGLKKN